MVKIKATQRHSSPEGEEPEVRDNPPNDHIQSFHHHKHFILGKPAARIGDTHTCNLVTPQPHEGGMITGSGCTTVMIGGLPAAVAGDICICNGPLNAIAGGSSTVLIGGKPAARLGDATVHGGRIVTGCKTVLIGGAQPVIEHVSASKEELSLSYGKPVWDDEDETEFVPNLSKQQKQEIITQTISHCILLLKKKIKLLNINDSKTLDQFKLMFGTDDENAKVLIIKRMGNLLKACKMLTVDDFSDIHDENKRKSVYGLVGSLDKSYKIYLGDKFWKERPHNKNRRAGILAHELSHFKNVGNTEDSTYGKYCLKLAECYPERALYNADSFEYFLEM